MKTLNVIAAAFAFCSVAACVEPAPAAELNIDNVKRIMKAGADLSGGSLTNTKTTATFSIVSNTADSTTSSTVAPITLKAGADITGADLLLDVQDSSGNHAFKVTEAGAATALTSLTATTTVNATTDLTVAGNDLTCTGTGQTCNLVSDAVDATTSTTVGAITLKSSVDVTNGDLVLNVENSAGDNLFTVDEQGAVTSLTTLNATTDLNVAGNDLTGTGTGQSFNIVSDTGDATTSASVAALVLKASVNVTDGDLLLDVQNSAAGTAFNVDEQGGVGGTTLLRGTCTLGGESPSVCTATVPASSFCTCSNVGATAAIAANGCAVGLSGTTLTVTSANGASNAVNYICFK